MDHDRRCRIGVIGPFTSNREVSRQLAGILAASADTPAEVSVFDQVSGALAPIRGLPIEERVDGVIILSVPIDDETERSLFEAGIPAVMIDLDHERLSSVVIDHRSAGFAAGTFLAGRGHERIAYVGHRQEHNFDSQSRQKLEGLTKAVPVIPDVFNTDLSLDAAIEAGRQILSGQNRPTAVFAHTDSLAAGVLTAAHELGLDAPDDIAIVGFNDTEIAELLNITTFRQPFEEAGARALKMLTSIIDAPEHCPRKSLTIVPELVERATA